MSEEVNYTALKDRIDELYDWKKGTQTLELERAEARGSQRKAVENLEQSVHALFDAVRHMNDAKSFDVQERNWRKTKAVGSIGGIVAVIEFIKWLISLLVM